ncbi:MAG: peptidylprolyl isomerase [Thermoanaerobaculia bacterium]
MTIPDAIRSSLAAAFLGLAATAGAPAGAAEAPPAPGPETPAEEPVVVATVNGEPVYLEDVEGSLGELHGRVTETRRDAFHLDQLVERLVNDILLAGEARALEMHREPPVVARIEARREELAVSRLEREEIRSRADVTDEEVRAAFQELYRRVTLRVLTTETEAEAREALAALESGADFAALARERSRDPYGPRGGLVESLPRVDLQRAVADAAFTLEPGERFGPVATEIGWAVLEVVSFEPPDPERFEAVRREIRETVRFRKAEAAREALGRRLRERHPVTVDAEAVASIDRERLPDGRLMPQPADPDAVVARVGERAIRAEDYAQALQVRWAGVSNEVAAEAAAPIVLDRMIGAELLAAEALARGYGSTPEAERSLRALESRLLVGRYLREVVAPRVEVSREAMEAHYREHRDAYRKPPRLHLAQITVPTREEAERLAELARGGAEFAWLARRHSTDGHREAGGETGWTEPRPGLDPLQDALLDARVGDVLGPFGAEDRFTLVEVRAREEQGVYPFQEVSGNVHQAVFEREARAVIDELVTTLRERSEIVVHRDVLARLGVTGSVEDEEAAPAGGAPAHGHGEP